MSARRSRNEPTRAPVRKRRWLRWLGASLLVLVVILAAIALWVLQTESGARFVLSRVEGALDGKLSIGRTTGTLAGPLEIENLRYLDAAAGVDARIAQARIDLAVGALLAGRIGISDLDAQGLDVALTSVPTRSDEAGSTFSPEPPIDIALERLVLTDAKVRQDGADVIRVDRLELAGAWTQAGLLVKTLALRSPDGQIDLDGTLSTQGGYSGSANGRFDWRVGERRISGSLRSESDGSRGQFELSLVEPTAANVRLNVDQKTSAPWTLVLDVPDFAATRIAPDSTLGQLGLHLEGSGDRGRADLKGTLRVKDHRLSLDPATLAFDDTGLHIEALRLGAAGTDGHLELHGDIDMQAEPLQANLEANWDAVALPADLVGQELASSGHLAISGSPEQFATKGALTLGPPGTPADIEIDLHGTPSQITLDTIRLAQAQGGLDASGTITLQPQAGWNLDANARQFDPGAFFADWPGAIDFNLETGGVLSDDGPDATLKLDKVGGTLRERPLRGQADLVLKPGYVVSGSLSLASGKSELAVEGRGGTQTDAQVRVDVASLGDWLPAAGGSARGNFHVSGEWPTLDLDGDLNASELAWQGIRARSVEAVAKLDDLAKPAGAITIKASNLRRGGIEFDTFTLEADGNAQSHRLSLEAKGTPASLNLRMAGDSADGHWNGQVSELEILPRGRNLPDLVLDAPLAMHWDGTRFELAEACLLGRASERTRQTADASAEAPADSDNEQVPMPTPEPLTPAESPARLCVSGSQATDGTLAAHYSLQHLPLRLLSRLAAPDTPVRIRGELAGEGDIARAGNGPLRGEAHLRSDSGDLFFSGSGQKPALSYTGLDLAASLADAGTDIRVQAALDHDGRLDGTLKLTPAEGDTEALAGRIRLDLNSLAFLELLTSEVAAPKGTLSADYAIAGTLDRPALEGALELADFAVEIPLAGLKLHDGRVTLRAADADRYVLEGSVKSGDGALTLSGEGGLGEAATMKATIKGEQFLAADIPAARVVLSPDLSVERDENGYRVNGSLSIPSANVDLAKLPGGGANAASPDVVVVDAEQVEPGKPVPITARIAVSLGDKVKLQGYGFDGTISGDLLVNERPGRATTGSGTLNAGGTYKAYGQNLKIETGRVLFAGTAIDNPGIDIRAVRKIEADNVTAGLLVRGTAQLPVLTVFSEPSMEQSEALSYLVTGKPLSSLKSGEGDMLGTAARALGTAGGDLLAKSIGGRLGVDDIGVADNGALGGAAFTVGKYLSPKLYLSYGVGIFEPGEVVTLRYLFSRHWNFEAQNATTGSRAGINYRIER